MKKEKRKGKKKREQMNNNKDKSSKLIQDSSLYHTYTYCVGGRTGKQNVDICIIVFPMIFFLNNNL